ncbi:MAG: AmmeMemoRadiSam system protein A [archaeon]
MVKKIENFSLSAEEKKLCVELAKRSIRHSLMNETPFSLAISEVTNLPESLKKKKACFVTLTKSKELRGCMGHLNAILPLYKDIIDNAFAAAFSDPRFDPLSAKEFSQIKVEVSVLTTPTDFEFKDSGELLKGIVPGEDGLIIAKGWNTATFLPSVWDELPKKEDFLSNLCIKAGLTAEDWKKPGLKVQKYKAIKAK